MIDFRYGATWYGNLISLIVIVIVAFSVFKLVKDSAGEKGEDKEKSSVLKKEYVRNENYKGKN